MKNRRFSKSDTAIAKLVAILMMMGHHLFGFPGRIPASDLYTSMGMLGDAPVESVVGSVCRLCVAFFLFLSGYGTYLSMRKKHGTAEITKRIRSLLSILWKVFVVFIPIAMLLHVTKVSPDATWKIEYTPLNALLNLIGFPKGVHTFNGEWWFVTGFLFILMGLPLIFKWLGRKHDNFYTDLLVIMCISLFSHVFLERLVKLPFMEDFYRSPWNSVILDIFGLLPAFLMGCIFAKNQVFEYLRKRYPNSLVQIVISVFLLVSIFVLRWKLGGKYDYLIVGPAVFAFVTILRKIPGVAWGAGKLTRYTTYVWLIHSFFCYQFCQTFVYSFDNAILIWIVLAVMSFGSAAIVYWCFRWLGKGYRRMKLNKG